MEREDVFSLVPSDALGIELGVAKGEFAELVLEKYQGVTLIGVDSYSDHHNRSEYEAALQRLARFGDRHMMLRETFDEALERFGIEGCFDLVYIDGYAHTGQEDGKTLDDWWPKVRPGGIFAGDDYCSEYQPTMDVVDAFMRDKALVVNVIPGTRTTIWSKHPTWWVRKP